MLRWEMSEKARLAIRTRSTGTVGRRRLNASAATMPSSASRKSLPFTVWKLGDMNSWVCCRIALFPKKPPTWASRAKPCGFTRLAASASASAAP